MHLIIVQIAEEITTDTMHVGLLDELVIEIIVNI